MNLKNAKIKKTKFHSMLWIKKKRLIKRYFTSWQQDILLDVLNTESTLHRFKHRMWMATNNTR